MILFNQEIGDNYVTSRIIKTGEMINITISKRTDELSSDDILLHRTMDMKLSIYSQGIIVYTKGHMCDDQPEFNEKLINGLRDAEFCDKKLTLTLGDEFSKIELKMKYE